MIKILHTADLHLGKEFKFLSEFGKELRETVKNTFSNIIELAIEKEIDLLLISGDLFDSNKVSSDLLGYVIDNFKKLKGITVCIIPGTHDCYDSSSVYRRDEFIHNLGNVSILKDSKPATKIFKELDIAVHSKANITNLGSESPLKGLKPSKETALNIALAHGSIKIEGKYNPNEYIINQKEIENSGMDYIALGHWHKCAEYSLGKTKAWYSGSPETLQFEDREKSGFVLLIELDKKICNIEKIKTGKYDWKEINIDTSVYPTADSLKKKILDYQGKDKIVRFHLKGLVSLDNSIDFFELENELKNNFAFLRIDSSKVHSDIPANVDNLFPAKTIGYNFIQILKEEIKKLPEERKGIYDEALRKGVALLLGKLKL
ncbi:MAG: metallophosphoesterase family protein [Candidatus Nealsonbacteria bacterium]